MATEENRNWLKLQPSSTTVNSAVNINTHQFVIVSKNSKIIQKYNINTSKFTTLPCNEDNRGYDNIAFNQETMNIYLHQYGSKLTSFNIQTEQKQLIKAPPSTKFKYFLLINNTFHFLNNPVEHCIASIQNEEMSQHSHDELKDELNDESDNELNDLSDNDLIPENWLLDLYGLADQVRKRHKTIASAVVDLKSQLNVPPILADVIARDVIDEIEMVDPYLKQAGGVAIYIPTKQLILLVGGYQENSDILSKQIWIYSLVSQTWKQINNITFEGYDFGAVLSSNERYVVLLGGWIFCDEECQDKEVKRILVLDMKDDNNWKISKCSICCPYKGYCRATRTGAMETDEILVTGFVKKCFKVQGFEHLPLPPSYIIFIILKSYRQEMIHWFKDNQHWGIYLKDILNAL